MEREGEGEGQKDRHILELQPIRTEDCNIRKVVQDNRHTEMTTWHHANVCFVYTSLVQKKKKLFHPFVVQTLKDFMQNPNKVFGPQSQN